MTEEQKASTTADKASLETASRPSSEDDLIFSIARTLIIRVAEMALERMWDYI